jgi:hypothetical protein
MAPEECMRFDQNGISLWFGTADAPAPGPTVVAPQGKAAGVTLTVAVSPLNANNKVDVYYRVNGGAPAKLAAWQARTDVRAQAQYFTAKFPELHVGDTVEYGASCNCTGRLVPSSGPPATFPASFRVVDGASATPPARTNGAGPSPPAPPAPALPPSAHPSGKRSIEGSTFVVSGVVSSPGRGGLPGLRVEVVDKDVGPEIVVATTVTDEHGHYTATFAAPALRDRNKTKPDLVARVVGAHGPMGTSPVHYDASPQETIDVSIPANAVGLPSEFEAVLAAVTSSYHGNLADLEESDHRQDLTHLAQKTGWDARPIAMLVLAEQMSRSTAASAGTTLDPAFYYALFRAGLPTTADALHAASAEAAAAVWKQAIEQGIIPRAMAPSVDGATATFRTLAAAHALEARPAHGLSTLRQILQVTIGGDVQRQATFAQLFTLHKNDPAALWRAVDQALGAETSKQLQLDGQIAHLTLENAPLLAALHRAEAHPPLASMADLVTRGYHQASKWAPLIGDAIPPEIPGGTVAERRSRYAEVLAAQLRLSFPTAAVTQAVHPASPAPNGSTAHANAEAVKAAASAFLLQHHEELHLGNEPVERYLARKNLTGTVPPPVVAHVKSLQRVYQITPNDHASAALLNHGVDSAYAVTRYDAAGFARAFGAALGGEQVARQVHAKATIVHATTLGILTSYLQAQHAPPLGPTTRGPAMGARPGGAASRPKSSAHPTLETLLGSMDYCACTECRSVLGPAAYFVDLLEFLDAPDAGARNPQAVLLARRPDLQYLPLTCENTNTALPYIDLVNETLEYFVANQFSLADFRGHSTDASARTDELMASPTFVHDAAYDILKTSLFPIRLPFHRPLELVRRHLQKLGVPLVDLMTDLRAGEALDRGADGYAWRDILMERLGLSRTEYQILTDATLSLQQIYGYSTLSDADVVKRLSSFKDYSRRVGVTYEELTAVLRTWFVNPSSAVVGRLVKLGVPVSSIDALKKGTMTDAAFAASLPSGLDVTEFGGDAAPPGAPADYGAVLRWLKDGANYAAIMGLVTVAGPDAATGACSADQLVLRYANPDPASGTLRRLDFVRLLRFIRLWRTLGWSIQQTDDLLAGLHPVRSSPTAGGGSDLQQLDADMAVVLRRAAFVLQLVDMLHLSPERDLASLLACWAPISTRGERSLYERLFRNPSLLKQDPSFADDGYGNVLHDTKQTLFAHEAAVRAALSLTSAELALITAALGFDATTPLTLDAVSAVYRRGWLARTLRLSVAELLLLVRWTRLDPFAPLDPGQAAPVEPPAVRFVRFVQALKDAAVKPAQALYVLWNQDVTARAAPSEVAVCALARTLRADFASIESEFALVDDPKGEVAKKLLGLVYGADAAGFFFGLLDATVSVSAPYASPGREVPAAVLDAAGGRLGYDDLRKQLTFAGVLDDAVTRPVLEAAAGDTALLAALSALSKASHQSVDPFFAAYPELASAYATYAASKDPPAARRTALLAMLLPELKRRRKSEQALSAIGSALGTDASFGTVLLGDASVMHAAEDATAPAVADLTGIETPGLSAEGGPGGDPSTTWSGYLSAPKDGFYNIAVTPSAGTSVALHLAGTQVTMSQSGGSWNNQSPIKLTAGALVPLRVVVDGAADPPSLTWQTKGVAWQPVPGGCLYPRAAVERLRATYIRFIKATSLAASLSLSASDLAYTASTADFDVGAARWLDALPASAPPDAAAAGGLAAVFVALLDFARIKRALAPDGDEWLGVLRDPLAKLSNGDSALLALTRWDPSSLSGFLTRFSGGPDPASLKSFAAFRRVHDAFLRVRACGISAADLAAAATNDPSPATAANLQAAVRALYSEADWLTAVKPINDEMRSMQREALVALVLNHLGDRPPSPDGIGAIDTPDKLFEYLLMDVEMAPCTATSRIRNALSSVQLFIERTLRSLEPEADASHIKADEWPWMKRYRVWQANREVFLWPENWLDPELRDGQSFIFKDTIGELLQSEITDDSATSAFHTYLARLEEIAKLEPCGIHCVPAGPGSSDETMHVVARTSGAKRKYHYRRYELGTWTTWEDVKLDIEDNPVVPVVWEDRLLLVWLRLLKKTVPDPSSPPTPPSSSAHKDEKSITNLTLTDVHSQSQTQAAQQSRVTVQAVVCWSEYVDGKWQPTKTSDVDMPTTIGQFDTIGAGTFHRSRLRLHVQPIHDAHAARPAVVGPLPGVAAHPAVHAHAAAHGAPAHAPVGAGKGAQHPATARPPQKKRSAVVHAPPPGDPPPPKLLDAPPPGSLLVDIEYVVPARVQRSGMGDPSSDSCGFVLYNTHSLPIRLEEFKRPKLGETASHRDVEHTASALSVRYRGGASLGHDVLRTEIGGRVVEPQRGLSPSDAPFFFEDSRNVFYVTTHETHEPIQISKVFGGLGGPAALRPITAHTFTPVQRGVAPKALPPVQMGNRAVGPAGSHPVARPVRS